MEDLPQYKKKSKSKRKTTLQIDTIIGCRYKVFDKSGKLPFSIVFGLCRRSSEDKDPRPLVLETANSLLDVPYALSHGLIQLRLYNERTHESVQIDLGHISQPIDMPPSELTLSSPVNRQGHWKESMAIFQYPIDPGSELASLLEPGKKYSIQNLRGHDFGGEYTFKDSDGLHEGHLKLVCPRANGRASFAVADSLPWPPQIQTRMQWHESKRNETANEPECGKLLEVSVLNMGTEPVTVQTRGTQRFCVPSGPLDAEKGHVMLDIRSCIIDAKSPEPISTLQLIDAATGDIVKEAKGMGICRPPKKPDPRPTLEELITLKPNEPLHRCIEVGKVVSKLPDGKYHLRMEPRGMWWCMGSREEFATRGEDRVPSDLYQTLIPPLVLECDDLVEVQVENGKAI